MKKKGFPSGTSVSPLIFLMLVWSMVFSPTILAVTNWSSPPLDLSALGQDANDPQISLSSDGTKATAVWTVNDGANSIVQSASATISGNVANWSSAVNLSQNGQDANDPQISLSSDGTKATAVWIRYDGANLIVQSASATISGNTASWSSAVNLSQNGQGANFPQISLSSDGTKATAVWARNDGASFIVQSASAAISGSTANWSSAVNLSQNGTGSYPEISLSSDGTKATAVWIRYDGANLIVQSASATISSNTASWSSAFDLSQNGRDATFPQISLSSDGAKATAVWSRDDGANWIVQSASATLSGNAASWSSAVNLSQNGQYAGSPQISLSSDGTQATAVWSRSNGSYPIIQSASATISGNIASWSLAVDLSQNGQDAGFPQISLSSDGTKATAVWIRYDGANLIVQSASATISGNISVWSSAVNLSQSGRDAALPQILLSTDGTTATAVWRGYDGANSIVQSASAAPFVPPPPPNPIPTLSEWAQIVMMLVMIGTAGWYVRRVRG